MATTEKENSAGLSGRTSDESTTAGGKQPNRREFLKTTAAGLVGSALVLEGCEFPSGSEEEMALEGPFTSDWPEGVQRLWLGPEYWTNPLQDWRLAEGRAELIAGGSDRNVQLLTHYLSARDGSFEASVLLGFLDVPGTGRSGFELGVQGELDDYRFNAIHGSGLRAGVTSDGYLFIREGRDESIGDSGPMDEVELHVSAEPGEEAYILTLEARDPESGETLGTVRREDIAADRLAGNIAIFADHESDESEGGTDPERGTPRLWFRDIYVDGPKVGVSADRMFGPVLWAQYTLSRGVMKMTAQMPPVGSDEARTVELQVQRGRSWETVGDAPIDELARTATFRIPDWEASRDVPYRLVYPLQYADGEVRDFHYEGTVRKDPVDQESIVMGALSCQTDFCFPYADVAAGVRHHDPDLLAFTGDQFYESSGGYGVVRDASAPISLSSVDYLRKWYLHGWAFGDLMRDRPTICIPDDHDVYQGNIWGQAGRDIGGYDEHNSGGYYMPAEWINIVQRTQTSHLPDPYDPTPVEQDITVYYTDMTYGRVSFAILEDRKWKSGPDGLIPPHEGRVDHITDPDFDPESIDVEEAVLLGDRQLNFLDDWATNWQGVDIKTVVSQTAFAQVPNYHGRDWKRLVADLDSNGWPQTPRDEALRRIRKPFAFHIGGDQHLPMILHYGIDDWNDAGYNYSVPAISTGYPRAFLPDEPGQNHREGMPEYTGEYTTGLGNKVTVWAVANPRKEPRQPMLERLVDKSSGYGIVRFDKSSREITMEAWPATSDPSGGEAAQFRGWPRTIGVEENYAREPSGYLPTLSFSGVTDPMIQVVDEATGELVYALRVDGTEYRPKVFREGSYTIEVGNDDEWLQTVEGVQSIGPEVEETLEIQV
jgi:phosphodiesterase/alkaline phosphatase D-like protein